MLDILEGLIAVEKAHLSKFKRLDLWNKQFSKFEEKAIELRKKYT